jgi:hypothetical protein
LAGRSTGNDPILLPHRHGLAADITLVTDKPSFIKLVLLGSPLPEGLQSKLLTPSGNADKFKELMSLFDEFPTDFNIVLPKKQPSPTMQSPNPASWFFLVQV